MARVIVIGSVNYDNFLSVENLPLVGQTIYASSILSACGGKGANQAVQCAKLGMETMMAGAVGTDAAGAKLLESLRWCCAGLLLRDRSWQCIIYRWKSFLW